MLSPDPAAFCLANVAAQGLSRGRCGGLAGQPLLESLRVTGDESERVESPDRVRRVVPSVQARSPEGSGESEGCFQFIREKLILKRRKFSLEFPEG